MERALETQGCIIKLISFNLKRDFGIPLRRWHKWSERRQLAAKLIRDTGAHIIGVQEMLPAMREDVERLLEADYRLLGFGRFSGKKPKDDEHSDIIVKNEDITVHQVKTFWLSKNPERISRAYYAMFPRICTVAEVHFNLIGRTIRVFNTHLDHICGVARVLGVEVILQQMVTFHEQNPMPIVLMGDLNSKPDSRPVQMLRSHIENYPKLRLVDVYSVMSPEQMQNTLHNFSGKIKNGAHAIDYIFVSEDFEIIDARVLTEPVEGRYPSDHYPLMAMVRLKEACEAQPETE